MQYIQCCTRVFEHFIADCRIHIPLAPHTYAHTTQASGQIRCDCFMFSTRISNYKLQVHCNIVAYNIVFPSHHQMKLVEVEAQYFDKLTEGSPVYGLLENGRIVRLIRLV